MSTTSEQPAQQQPIWHLARSAVETGVRRVVEAQTGDTGFVTEPIYPGASTNVYRARADLALKAALLVRQQADGVVYETVQRCRGAGVSWAQLAELLGLDAKDHPNRSLGEVAFEQFCPPEPGMFHHPSIIYHCGSCDSSVIDKGPYESHPADNESGHAEDCARFRAAEAAWQRDHR